jgi:hypothetical protein
MTSDEGLPYDRREQARDSASWGWHISRIKLIGVAWRRAIKAGVARKKSKLNGSQPGLQGSKDLIGEGCRGNQGRAKTGKLPAHTLSLQVLYRFIPLIPSDAE